MTNMGLLPGRLVILTQAKIWSQKRFQRCSRTRERAREDATRRLPSSNYEKKPLNKNFLPTDLGLVTSKTRFLKSSSPWHFFRPANKMTVLDNEESRAWLPLTKWLRNLQRINLGRNQTWKRQSPSQDNQDLTGKDLFTVIFECEPLVNLLIIWLILKFGESSWLRTWVLIS